MCSLYWLPVAKNHNFWHILTFLEAPVPGAVRLDWGRSSYLIYSYRHRTMNWCYAYGPADATATRSFLASLKSRLVPDCQGCPRKEAVKRVSVIVLGEAFFGIRIIIMVMVVTLLTLCGLTGRKLPQGGPGLSGLVHEEAHPSISYHT